MRFLHISDTHLGYQQYNLKERERDFFNVFQEAIDKAIEKNVDFIIHTGDFFHSSRPSNESILDGLYLIKKLKTIKSLCL
jgi:DNA repair exonuclease SbcCD nuclease subunit